MSRQISATPPPDPDAELRWLDEHPIRWATFSHGYASGYRHGLEDGRRLADKDAARDWAQVADYVRRMGSPQSGALSYAEQEQRRTTYSTPARTPEEIKVTAQRSWAEVERRIRVAGRQSA